MTALSSIRLLAVVLAGLLSGLAASASAAVCPPQAGDAVAAGWRSYRADSVKAAVDAFSIADGLCPDNFDAKVGLGYGRLRLGLAASAESLFHIVIERDSLNLDAWSGLVLSVQRQGSADRIVSVAHSFLRLYPGDATALRSLDLHAPGWDRGPRPARPRSDTLQLTSRTRGNRFEIATPEGWRDFYIKGVNLGVAMPGKFPSQFPGDSATYAGWFELLAGMNANTVRVYTILPPEFYRALRGWNEHQPENALWLIHGVWTELPPDDDFEDPAWKTAFRAEIDRVVDVVHGAKDLDPRAGHASGRYDADVSPWTLAVIIGREWEPYAIVHHDARHTGARAYQGRFLEMDAGSASEAWMAEQCDYLLSYEVDTYNALRPIAFTNWPTLDPLHHPTESNSVEEKAWRRILGRPVRYRKLEYDNDAISLDANHVRTTPANPAGWFASYHAYPYYPDFMLYDRDYNRASSSEGRSNYFGYLSELRRHHDGMPLVIAEYGVPSSRGIAHFESMGWHHGGHDEAAMAEIDARLTREIRESGAAGGILFAWLDEWFKKNWVVVDLQIPLENTRKWHNAMDAEQNYGIIALLAGDSASTPELGGDVARWHALPTLATVSAPVAGAPASLRVGHDASYVYLAVAMAAPRGRPFPWDSMGIAIAIDSFRPDLGQHRLPVGIRKSEIGFEFLAEFRGVDNASLRVTPDYNTFAPITEPKFGDDRGAFYKRPVRTVARNSGRFDSLLVTTNRTRVGRDGTIYPAIAYDRGSLRFGTRSQSSLSDWYYDEDEALLEVRLPWGLLNVSDPSTRRVLYEKRAGGSFGTAPSDGFRFGVITYGAGQGGGLVGALPEPDRRGRWLKDDFASWTWPEWSEPVYHQRLKPVYHALREVWSDSTRSVTSAPLSISTESRSEP